MESSKVVVVLGATGAQGGSVVRALASSPGLLSSIKEIRCLTRNPGSPKSVDLKKLSNKVSAIQCDLFDKDQVGKAFQGAWAVYASTNFWDPSVHSLEYELGKSIVDAAVSAGVSYFIWSSLDNAKEISQSKFDVPHFTLKAQVEDHLRKVDSMKWIIVKPAQYYSNLLFFFPPKKSDTSDEYCLSLPISGDAPVSSYDVEDTGPVVARILYTPDDYVGKSIPLVGETISYGEMARRLGAHSGKKISYKQESPQESKLYPEIVEMLQYFQHYGYYNPKDNEESLDYAKSSLYPGMKTFAEFLALGNHKLE